METPSHVNAANVKWKIRAFVLLLVLLVVAVLVSLLLRAPMPKVVILPFQEQTPSKLRIFIERGWSWLLFHLLGPGRSILLSASIMDFKSLVPLSSRPLAKPNFSDTNGLEVWILKDDELKSLHQQMKESPGAEMVSSPRIQTASGIQGAMFIGQMVPVNGTNQEVGFGLKCLPRLRKGSIDLTSTLTFTQVQDGNPTSIKTNLAVRSRVQIPKGSGVFLLNADRSATNGKIIGILISPTVQ